MALGLRHLTNKLVNFPSISTARAHVLKVDVISKQFSFIQCDQVIKQSLYLPQNTSKTHALQTQLSSTILKHVHLLPI